MPLRQHPPIVNAPTQAQSIADSVGERKKKIVFLSLSLLTSLGGVAELVFIMKRLAFVRSQAPFLFVTGWRKGVSN